MPTVLRDGEKSWKFYGQGKAGLICANSEDGMNWQDASGALEVPVEARAGFTPVLDTRNGVQEAEKYKALGGSAEAGGLFALASNDGKVWRKLNAQPVIISSAQEALYGRNSAIWSEADQAYAAFVSERRDARRVISRSVSKDFHTWSPPMPLKLNAAGVTDWRSMIPSPFVPFVRPEAWTHNDEQAFFTGRVRYEILENRVLACTARAFKPALPADEPGAWDSVVITTQPFVVTGSSLELNASTDAFGAIRAEILGVDGKPLPGYRLTGSRRELFVDRYLIDKLTGAQLVLHTPQPAPPPAKPLPRIGNYGDYIYATVFRDGDIYRLYGRRERGKMLPDSAPPDERWFNQVTCYAESPDGINWTEPNLGIYDNVPEIKAGNVTLAWEFGATHNFTPFLDTNPAAPAAQRYKGIAGVKTVKDPKLLAKYGVGGLRAYVSHDGVRWKRLRDDPIIPDDWGAFDSQNVAFWSESEQCYVCYFTRVNFDRNAPSEVLLMTSRDGVNFDRTFTDVFSRPGAAGSYGNRGHYLAHHLIQTGPAELSVYNYYGRRWTLRLDGLASLNAPFAGGEMLTKPLVFDGDHLVINACTAGIGFVRVEIQEAEGKPIEGYTLEDCRPMTGDEVSHTVSWKAGPDVSKLSGKHVRLRFVMKDADIYSLRFEPAVKAIPAQEGA